MSIMYTATCTCGWSSGPQESVQKMQKAAKQHKDDTAHTGTSDTPLF